MFSSPLSTCERSRWAAVMLLVDVLPGYTCAKGAASIAELPAAAPVAARGRSS